MEESIFVCGWYVTIIGERQPRKTIVLATKDKAKAESLKGKWRVEYPDKIPFVEKIMVI